MILLCCRNCQFSRFFDKYIYFVGIKKSFIFRGGRRLPWKKHHADDRCCWQTWVPWHVTLCVLIYFISTVHKRGNRHSESVIGKVYEYEREKFGRAGRCVFFWPIYMSQNRYLFFCLFGFAFVCFVVALVFLIKDLLISFSVQLPLAFEREWNYISKVYSNNTNYPGLFWMNVIK